MAEQQLVDYIKKAKEAGLADDQIKSLLLKNGWAEAEINEAFVAATQTEAQSQAQPQPEPEVKPAEQPEPEPAVQPQPEVQPQPQVQTQQPEQSNMPRARALHLVGKLLMVLIIVVVLGGAGYFAAGQYINLPFITKLGFLQNLFGPSPETVVKNMSSAMKNVKSFHTATQVDVSNTPAGKLSFNVNGESDVAIPASPKASFKLVFNGMANVSIIVAGNAAYVELNSGSYPGLDASKITGKWFKFDQASINALSSANISLDFVQKIQAFPSSVKTFSFVKKFPDETKSGQNTYHYLLTASNTIFGDINMDVWIGKKNYMPYEVKLDKTINGADIKLDMVNSNFNIPITAIAEPTNSQKIEDIILPLLKTQKIKSDMGLVNSVAGTLFSTTKSYATFCKAGLLNGYLKMGLLGFSNDMVSQGATKPVCFADAQNYCVSTQLPDGSYVSIDNNGNCQKTKCVSSKTTCK